MTKRDIAHNLQSVEQFVPHQLLQDRSKANGITAYPEVPKEPNKVRLQTLGLKKQDIIDILVSYNGVQYQALYKKLNLKSKPNEAQDSDCLINRLFALWILHPEATTPLDNINITL